MALIGLTPTLGMHWQLVAELFDDRNDTPTQSKDLSDVEKDSLIPSKKIFPGPSQALLENNNAEQKTSVPTLPVSTLYTWNSGPPRFVYHAVPLTITEKMTIRFTNTIWHNAVAIAKPPFVGSVPFAFIRKGNIVADKPYMTIVMPVEETYLQPQYKGRSNPYFKILGKVGFYGDLTDLFCTELIFEFE